MEFARLALPRFCLQCTIRKSNNRTKDELPQTNALTDLQLRLRIFRDQPLIWSYARAYSASVSSFRATSVHKRNQTQYQKHQYNMPSPRCTMWQSRVSSLLGACPELARSLPGACSELARSLPGACSELAQRTSDNATF